MARDEGYLSSKDGTRLFHRSVTPDGPVTAHVAVLHGYGDHSGRYAWVMDSLAAKGFSSSAIDYRGHGKSDGPKFDVVRWSDYLDDLEACWRKARDLAAGKPTFLLAHSNGALIATHWAAQQPVGLKGLVLSAPFYALAFTPPAVKVLAARVVRRILPGLHMSNELSVTQFSRDEAWQRSSEADPLRGRETTPRWFLETEAAQQQLTGLGKRLTVPLFMGCGADDPVASTPAAKGFFETVGAADKTYKSYQGFRHEIFAELGKEEWFSDIAQWISAHC